MVMGKTGVDLHDHQQAEAPFNTTTPTTCPLSLLLAGATSCRCPRHQPGHICSLTSGFQINCFQINMLNSCRHSWGLLSLPEPWVKVLQLRLASVPTEPQLSTHSKWRQGHHDSVISKLLLVKSSLYILEDRWYAECSNQLTVVRQFPEHLDLQLVVMVMRGSDL